MAASTYNFEKDPDDTLDYTFDWTAWLNGDQISAFTAIPSPGITVTNTTFTTNATTAWVSGGTAGIPYYVTHRVTTAGGRQKDLTMTFRVANK